MEATTIILREGDVYSFRYNEEETKKRFEPYHCFDGQLIVRKYGEGGEMRLVDTYWGSGDNRTFTLEEALNKGHLAFKCNLSDVEEIREWEKIYYDDSDLFDLSTQHHCHNRYAKRKGAERSKEKMMLTLLDKITSSQHKIQSLQKDIERAEENLKKLEAGDTSIYI